MKTHAELINLWPTLSDFAQDIGAKLDTARVMRKRSIIPASRWKRLMLKAQERGIDINLETLFEGVTEKVPKP